MTVLFKRERDPLTADHRPASVRPAPLSPGVGGWWGGVPLLSPLSFPGVSFLLTLPGVGSEWPASEGLSLSAGWEPCVSASVTWGHAPSICHPFEAKSEGLGDADSLLSLSPSHQAWLSRSEGVEVGPARDLACLLLVLGSLPLTLGVAGV